MQNIVKNRPVFLKIFLFISIFLIFFSNIFLVNAQEKNIIVIGHIINKVNNLPLPYANIQLENNSIGVVSNKNGEFKIVLNNKYFNSNLIISYLGFTTQKLSIASLQKKIKNDIYLSPKVYLVNNINIKPKNPKQIILEAIQRIPENYHKNPVYLNAYYRELMKENDKYIWMADAACSFYITPYQDKYDKKESIKNYFDASSFYAGDLGYPLWQIFDNIYTDPNDKVKIIQARSSDNLSNSITKFDIIGGPEGLIALDKVNYNIGFLSEEKINKYSFKLDTITNYNDRKVYKISFRTKHKQNIAYKGDIYIDITSKAFVKLNYETDINESLKDSKFKISINNYYRKKAIKATANYKKQNVIIEYKLLNETWYLSYIKEERKIDYAYKRKKIKTIIATIRELLVNDIQIENVKPFNDDEIFKNNISNVFYENSLNYNELFWNNYNLLVPTFNMNSIKNDLEINSKLQEQFANKAIKNDKLKPPIAKVIPVIDTVFNEIRIDDYKWIENLKDSSVISYIQEENHYTKNYFIPLKELQRKIYNEIKERLDINENTVESGEKIGNYIYYLREKKGSQYGIVCRKKNAKNSKEEIIIDINKLSYNNIYFNLTDLWISPDNNILAYGVDLNGGFKLNYYFLDLNTHRIIDTLTAIQNFTVSNSNQTFLYTKLDSTNRNYIVFKHIIGKNQKDDELIYFEKDVSVDLHIKKLKSGKYILIYASVENDKKRLIINSNLEGKPVLLPPLIYNNKYSVNHINNKFYFLLKSDNVVLSCSTISDILNNNFTTEYTCNDNSIIVSYRMFIDYMAILERKNMVYTIVINNRGSDKAYSINFKEDTHDVSLLSDQDFESSTLKYSYTSLKTPYTIFEYNLKTKKKIQIYKESVNNYNPHKYVTNLIWVKSKDSVNIPVSLFYKKGLKRNGENYLYLTGYGASGGAQHTIFNGINLSLVNRGFIYAIAHVRGGSELGVNWYKQGKLLNKKNTFNDFIACLNYFIDNKYTIPAKIVIEGGSAGGLIMGYVANTHPEMVNTIILNHPFVDITNTLLDSTKVFTTISYGEYGNPNTKKYYKYINSYSPYDNIKTQEYPNMLFLTSIFDEQVMYWEPVKMAAKLRKNKTDKNILLLKTDFNSGHTGSSGKYSAWNDRAYTISLILYNLKK